MLVDTTVSVVKDNRLIDINSKEIMDCGSEMSLDCCANRVFFHSKKICLDINEKQKRLLLCLFNDINRKRDIIRLVWYENYMGISDNNYHQLVHKMRALFQKAGIPKDLIKTINRYGLRLDVSLLTHDQRKGDMRFEGYCLRGS